MADQDFCLLRGFVAQETRLDDCKRDVRAHQVCLALERVEVHVPASPLTCDDLVGGRVRQCGVLHADQGDVAILRFRTSAAKESGDLVCNAIEQYVFCRLPAGRDHQRVCACHCWRHGLLLCDVANEYALRRIAPLAAQVLPRLGNVAHKSADTDSSLLQEQVRVRPCLACRPRNDHSPMVVARCEHHEGAGDRAQTQHVRWTRNGEAHQIRSGAVTV
mmetsp:Transcript_77343/g.214987  ORF Transcript_77343/g.214987 Transcript_77343/m.214987 type:complete len:218 (+) Transcript_77343:204-857(+)